MAIIEYVKLAAAFFLSIGGASVVVVALAKWLVVLCQVVYLILITISMKQN